MTGTNPMSFSQLKKPKSPFPCILPINFDRYVGPPSVMKLHFVQPICQSTSYCFDICFFQTPISAKKYKLSVNTLVFLVGSQQKYYQVGN